MYWKAKFNPDPEASGRDVMIYFVRFVTLMTYVPKHWDTHLSYPTKLSVSEMVNSDTSGLKGRSVRLLLNEYPVLRKRYWGKHSVVFRPNIWFSLRSKEQSSLIKQSSRYKAPRTSDGNLLRHYLSERSHDYLLTPDETAQVDLMGLIKHGVPTRST